LLQILEENGLSHGDIAPSNLLIAPDGSVHLIDFDGFLAFDPDVPAPDTIGQRPMLAPEQRNGTQPTPTRESGYFQTAMMISMIAFGHYPTDGMPSEPNAVDQVICQGRWPEHDRPVCPDDLPIEALGSELVGLFDRAFSLNLADRPGPDEWRRALTRALQNCWIHDCGEAFVADINTAACPGCGATITIPKATRELKIQLLPNGPRFGVELKDRSPVVLGRSTMPGLSPTVSNRHLEILPFGEKFLLRHVGSNPTLIEQNGQWYQLNEIWLDQANLKGAVQLQLADQRLALVSGT
jgi:serine/threonine protein kinase